MSNNYQKIFINEKIKGIKIIYDQISIPSENLFLEYDMAIEFITDDNSYLFSRANYFSDLIFVQKNKEYNSVYSVSKVIESFQGDDNNLEVKVNRVVKTIDERIKDI